MSAPAPLSQPPTIAASLSQVSMRYGGRGTSVTALADVSWQFRTGSFTAVMGPSGSGKTTLLQTIAGLTTPTSGEVRLGEDRIDQLSERALAVIRRNHVGFVFQHSNLIAALTARENITLPPRLARRRPDADWFAEITQRAAISDRLDHLPDQLSGGQQQRVALCRALVGKPRLLCADEPTGSLDSTASAEVMRLLREAVDAYAQTLVLVTHDPVVAAYADQVLFLVDGRVTDTIESPTAQHVAATVTATAAKETRASGQPSAGPR